jgi:hypothetical protein
MLDEKAADERAEHGRKAKDAAEDPLVPATLARRDDVAHCRHGRDDQAAATEALQGAEADQLDHRLADAAER